MVGEVLGGMAAFNNMLNIAKGLLGIRDEVARSKAVFDLQKEMLAAQAQRKIAAPVACGFIGRDARGNLRGTEFLRVNETDGIIETSGMRAQSFSVIPGHLAELLGQILTIFVHERLGEYLVSGSGLTPLASIYRLSEKYRSK